MSSLDTIATIQKNGVIAINGLNQTLVAFEGVLSGLVSSTFPTTISGTISASSTHQEVVGSGRILSISIPVSGGSSQVFIYDSATTGGISSANLIFASLPANSSLFTTYLSVNLPYSNGLVLKTDSGMNFCVAYTPNA